MICIGVILFHHNLAAVHDIHARFQITGSVLHRCVAEEEHSVHRTDCHAHIAIGEYRLQSTYYRCSAVYNDIVGRHGLGEILPTGEGMALIRLDIVCKQIVRNDN